ncbi:hypothetical protein KU75_19410 [Pectobacterium odoriferum]|uniref:Uncharacterized protein n=1 Tax=Pectobacterium odoriferum TaxID=78398 RepID=A0ABR4VKU6_9GAMM|nr:hypothetical protein [Pectobacterium odoriferum]KGA39973.1 hypothetical protein KU75_19410 [Pectobacterium odoriferum]
MLKLINLLKFIVIFIVSMLTYVHFSEPAQIDKLNNWLQLLGGVILTPLAGYAWNLKGKFEKLIDNDGLSSVDVNRLGKHITQFVTKIWILILFYIVVGAFLVIPSVINDDPQSLRVLSSASMFFLLVSLFSALSLKKNDVALTQTKIDIEVRKKRNQEREAMLKKLMAHDEFSEKEKKYFKRYNEED